MGESVVQEIFTELLEDSGKAFEITIACLPDGFPASITNSIIGGYKARLPQIERFLGESRALSEQIGLSLLARILGLRRCSCRSAQRLCVGARRGRRLRLPRCWSRL
jgi:hypothetical protein